MTFSNQKQAFFMGLKKFLSFLSGDPPMKPSTKNKHTSGIAAQGSLLLPSNRQTK